MTAIWLFMKDAFGVVAHGFFWILFICCSIATVVFAWSILCVRRSQRHHFIGADEWGPLLCNLVVACITGFFLWKIHGETFSNWFLTSPGMFGKEIGGFEQRFLDEQYPPKEEDDKLVDCWEWRYRKEDGRYIVPIKVPKPLNYFSEYNLHLLPISKRSFLISGNCFGAAKCDYEDVKSLLISKYGKPVEETGETCSFRDGEKKIGLVFTNVLGKSQLYINAYREDLLKENLPAEIQRLECERRHQKLDSL